MLDKSKEESKWQYTLKRKTLTGDLNTSYDALKPTTRKLSRSCREEVFEKLQGSCGGRHFALRADREQREMSAQCSRGEDIGERCDVDPFIL